MNIIRKRQVQELVKDSIKSQVKFIAQIFGVAV